MCAQAEKRIQQAKDVYFAKYQKENASAWELVRYNVIEGLD